MKGDDVMSGIVGFLLCLAIYFVYKKFIRSTAEKKMSKNIDKACVSTAIIIISNNNRVRNDITNDTTIMKTLCTVIKSLEKIHEIVPPRDSFAANYLVAAENKDYGYLRKAHSFLATRIETNPSQNSCTTTIMDFIHKEQPPELTKEIFSSSMTFEEYYAKYIEEIKLLEPSLTQDGLHWTELTDDEGARRAFEDGIPPKELAKYVHENVSIADIGFEAADSKP